MDQRERVALCSERILLMEEQVGMMAHNEAYKASIDGGVDDLYQDSMVLNEKTNNASTAEMSPENPATAQMIQRTATEEEPIMDRKTFNALNPASTTSSLDRLGSKQSKGTAGG